MRKTESYENLRLSSKTVQTMTPILPGAPWLIAHRAMLGVNQPYKITLNGQDYVLWQDSHGNIFALENVCPHRQAPLSDGWICESRNTLACPFHGLEFNGSGQFYDADQQRFSTQSLAQALPLFVQGDFVWSYGATESQATTIPELPQRLSQEMCFVGIAGDRSISADFLSTLRINYDFHHVAVTHRHPFRIAQVTVEGYETDGYHAQLTQHVVRDRNTLGELLQRPALAFSPQTYSNQFEYHFPTLTSLSTEFPAGKIISLLVIYPETEHQTRTFTLLFAQVSLSLLVPLLRRSIIDAYNLIVEQDVTMLEQCYPQASAKIRLPYDGIISDAETLYRNWPVASPRDC